ncbi:MAG: SDR family oxidoreductase [Firmicutes bacterium]|nr:SDR family oxidoreductase [Bacillota bacterium]
MKRLEDKICIITGADSEIGKSTARAFSEEGARLMLVGINHEHLNDLKTEISKNGSQVETFALDVALGDSINHIFEKTASLLGNVSVLVNIVLPFFHDGGEDVHTEKWDEDTARDARICFLCCRSAFAAMSGTGGGSIVNIAPATALKGLSGGNTMASVSGGIFAMTQTLAIDYAPSDVRVNAISLGVFKTDSYRDLREKRESEFEKKLLRHIPLGRLGKTDEIAKAAVFLGCSDSSYITGAMLPVDGGYSIG